MNPLDAYLTQIRSRLPRKRRDDILAELRATLEERLERREAEAGRALTASEATATLRSFGHPYLVAGRYWQGRGLLGGPLTPFYRSTLVWGFAAVILVQSVIAATQAWSAPTIGALVGGAITHIAGGGLVVFAATTAVFMALDAGLSFVQKRSDAAC